MTTTALTTEQVKRANQAIAETQRLLDREMQYPADLRKHDVVAKYEAHIAKVKNMIANGWDGKI